MVIDSAGAYGRPYPRRVAHRQRLLTTLHTLVYQLRGGRIGATLLGMPMLLLTTWGRRTGQLRTAPLLYLPVDDVFVLVASNGGARRHPTWWFNVRANPEALVQIGPVRGRVHAVPATPAERRASGLCCCASIRPIRATRPAPTARFPCWCSIRSTRSCTVTCRRATSRCISLNAHSVSACPTPRSVRTAGARSDRVP
jgi:deazaflavin-dependent oxidoreductase (nitroreductase family)